MDLIFDLVFYLGVKDHGKLGKSIYLWDKANNQSGVERSRDKPAEVSGNNYQSDNSWRYILRSIVLPSAQCRSEERLSLLSAAARLLKTVTNTAFQKCLWFVY